MKGGRGKNGTSPENLASLALPRIALCRRKVGDAPREEGPVAAGTAAAPAAGFGSSPARGDT